MTLLRYAFAFIAVMIAAGCATLFPQPLATGDDEAAIVQKWGRPTAAYQDGNIRILEYRRGPYEQFTYMARVHPTEGLLSAEQVLTNEKFATVQIGKTTRNDILLTFGRPRETSYLPLKDYEVWTYAYRESGVWNSLMHVHFDRSGVVQMMLSGPDPRFDADFGRGRSATAAD
ncbi:MAG TPA: hypothetical protein VM406_05560 [Noviherbaspirillum sp.]|nr:hypothetical protein [Noviherbaspirillum sp.]